MQRPLILSIAGHDPSAGAGVSADIKTAEMHGVYCMSCITSLTVQTESEFASGNFIRIDLLEQQIRILLEKYKFAAIKIGLIESLNTLDTVVSIIREYDKNVFIIWDPILKASTGFEFHNSLDSSILSDVLNKVNLITPNLPESVLIFPERNYTQVNSSVLLKGGHSENDVCADILYHNGEEVCFESTKLPYTKHGTGCILSSAIASNLALGHSLDEACKLAKDYINKALSSNTGLLAYHG
jgi:hydroxymethylpyrimidine/phosphomethylpyrimidine kinase